MLVVSLHLCVVTEYPSIYYMSPSIPSMYGRAAGMTVLGRDAHPPMLYSIMLHGHVEQQAMVEISNTCVWVNAFDVLRTKTLLEPLTKVCRKLEAMFKTY